MLDQFLRFLPAFNVYGAPENYKESKNRVPWSVQSKYEVTGLTVTIQLIQEEEESERTWNAEPRLLMNQECKLECIFLTVVMLYRVYRFHLIQETS